MSSLTAALYAQGFSLHESLIHTLSGLQDPNTGLTSFRSLHIPVGGRSEAMAGAFTAMTDDAAFFEYNPAASSLLKQTELAFFHNFWIADSAVDTLIFTQRSSHLGYGGALKTFYIPFTEYTIFGERASVGYYSETTAMLNLSYNFFAGYTFKGLALGGNLKSSFRSVPDYSDNIYGLIIPKSGLSQSGIALMADAGILMRFNAAKHYASREPNLHIGIAARNIGSGWTGFGKKITKDDPLPASVSAGIVYKIIKPLTLALDFQKPLNLQEVSKSERLSGSLGAEFFVTDFFALQGGILLKGANPKISLGSAVLWKQMLFNVAYSLDLTSSLAPLNKISLAVKMHLGDRGREKHTAHIYELYEEGLKYYTGGEMEPAIEKWSEVLALWPLFDPAKKGIRAAQNAIELQQKIKNVQNLY
ncbi:UPF0164 family protein [Treponema sp. HNW]|uniref:UPF0164 family protein n=1 Tax=Treponema sp. HNW TaxID=3116654 RepID=UPI003D13598A